MIHNKNITYNGTSYANQFNNIENTILALKNILNQYRSTLTPIINFDQVDILKDIKPKDDFPAGAYGIDVYGKYKNKSLQELSNINPGTRTDRRKWISAVLSINKKYLDELNAAPAAATPPIPVPPAVAALPSIADKEENKLTEQQKGYIMAYMVALSEVSKLNSNAIMTPQLMDFFHKSGFEVNPMGYDLMKTRPSRTFAENDIALLLTIGGYKLKSNSGNPIYSRF